MKRRILSQIITGSNLYGTNRPDSDIDYTGVFMPSRRDLITLQNCPTEYTENVKLSTSARNTVGDIDCKFYSIKSFLRLVTEGQPGTLEMLFAPPSHLVQTSKEWKIIQDNQDLFISQKGISPFIGFAIAQAHKASIKGDNLNALRAILAWGNGLTQAQYNMPLATYIYAEDQTPVALEVAVGSKVYLPGVTDYPFGLERNDHGFITLRVAGRQFDPGAKAKVFLNSISDLAAKYGTRSKAAAEAGYDFKSLMHAYRLLLEAEEFLKTGHITLPRPPGEAEMLRIIRSGEMYKDQNFDWHSDLMAMVDRLKEKTMAESFLPKEPKWGKVEALCERLIWDSLRKETRRGWFKGLFK